MKYKKNFYQIKSNSEIFEVYYSNPEEVTKQDFVEGTKTKIIDVYWFGYTAHANEILGFYEKDGLFKFISTLSKMGSLHSFLCESFQDILILLPDELADSIEGWIKL